MGKHISGSLYPSFSKCRLGSSKSYTFSSFSIRNLGRVRIKVGWSVANSSLISASVWEPQPYSDVRGEVLSIRRRFFVLRAACWVASVLFQRTKRQDPPFSQAVRGLVEKKKKAGEDKFMLEFFTCYGEPCFNR